MTQFIKVNGQEYAVQDGGPDPRFVPITTGSFFDRFVKLELGLKKKLNPKYSLLTPAQHRKLR